MTLSYFLGTGGKNGFFSCFPKPSPENEGEYTYYLKGGPGSGKSTLMKKIRKEMEENDIDCVEFCCSSDPDSLDALMIPSLRINIVDATAPHAADPEYPGATGEWLDPGIFRNREITAKNRDEIIRLTNINKELHEKSARFRASAFMLHSDRKKLMRQALDEEKIRRYASRTASKKISRLSSKIGKEEIRLMEAVTPKGFIFKNDTAEKLCTEAVIFDDDFSCAAEILLYELKNYALAAGYDVTISPFPGDGKCIRHIIIKELSLGFFTKDIFCSPEINPSEWVSLKRFYDSGFCRENRAKATFMKKASGEMLEEACRLIKSAKENHDLLEKLYIEAMDFEKLDEMTEKLKKRIWEAEWYPPEK